MEKIVEIYIKLHITDHMLGHSNRSKLHRNQERILNDPLNWVDRNHRH